MHLSWTPLLDIVYWCFSTWLLASNTNTLYFFGYQILVSNMEGIYASLVDLRLPQISAYLNQETKEIDYEIEDKPLLQFNYNSCPLVVEAGVVWNMIDLWIYTTIG